MGIDVRLTESMFIMGTAVHTNVTFTVMESAIEFGVSLCTHF